MSALRKLLITGPTIAIRPGLVAELGCAKAIFVQQVSWWSENSGDDDGWSAFKSYADWSKLTGLSREYVRKITREAVEGELVEQRDNGKKGTAIRYQYRLGAAFRAVYPSTHVADPGTQHCVPEYATAMYPGTRADGDTSLVPEVGKDNDQTADRAVRKRTPRDELFDAVCEACEWAHPVSRSHAARVSKLVTQLVEMNATPEQVHLKAQAYRVVMREAILTPEALLKHWPSLNELNVKRAAGADNAVVADAREAQRQQRVLDRVAAKRAERERLMSNGTGGH